MDEDKKTTYVLFGDGSATRLLLERTPADQDQKEKVRGIAIGIADKEVIFSADRAFQSAYHILNKFRCLKEKKYCFSYELEEGGDKVFGQSAGLAFALKFFQEFREVEKSPSVIKCILYYLKHKLKLSLNQQNQQKSQAVTSNVCEIAATGKITDHTSKARVKRVNKIEAKLKAALGILSEGGKIFFPYGNEGEVGNEIKEEARSKGIALIPVDTLREAIEELIPDKPPLKKIIEAIERLIKVLHLRSRKFFFSLFVFFLVGLLYLSTGILIHYYCKNNNIPLWRTQYITYTYPWINIYLSLTLSSSKEEAMIGIIEKIYLDPDHLKKHNWQLRGTIKSESVYIEGIYTVRLHLEDGSMTLIHFIKSEPLRNFEGKLCGTGSGSDLESARRRAVKDLWQKILVEMQKMPNEHVEIME